MKRYFQYLKEYKLYCFLGAGLKWIEAVLELLVPLVMANIINVGIAERGSIGYVLAGGGLMLAMGAVGFGCAMFCQRSASIASQGFGTNVRNALFRHINSLGYRELDKIGTASLMTRAVNDINQMQSAVAMTIRLVVRSPFIVAGAVLLCFIINWQIGLLVTGVTLAVGLILWAVMHSTVPRYTKNQKSLERLTQITNENLEGARVVRAFSQREGERERFNEAADGLLENSLKIGKISAWLNPLTYAVVNFGIALILCIAGWKMNTNSAFSGGNIIALINYMMQILNAMVVISNLVSLFTRAYASTRRVSEVFDLQPSVDGGGTESLDFTADAVSASHISFSYAGTQQYSLSDVSLTIPNGATVGIIGATGSGKSTFATLLSRMYDVSEGELCVFGRNVRQVSVADLRKAVVSVPQRSLLFSGTVRSNLLWGKSDATDEEMYSALKIACADEFVMEKGGLDAKVTEGGRNFSGGQRQRLTIARALTAQPKLLILDDSFSALDYATDAKLRRNISQMQGMTVILISQRVSSLKNADTVFVMEDGKVVGTGTHEQLYSGCELYREICDSQSGERE